MAMFSYCHYVKYLMGFNMSYRIEILTKTVDSTGAIIEAWRMLRPNNGSPYVFDTEKQAELVFNSCYPRGSKARAECKARIVKYEF